jgi:pantoate--beta-alanine ligase
MPTALIALGSNVGDRAAMLASAIELLRATPNIEVTRVSGWHETDPVGGPPDQGPYLNGAAVLTTSLDPESLLLALLAIEQQLGRVRTVKWGPRTIDLDLLLYDTLVVDKRELQIPHLRMAERRFVLQPAAEVAAEMRHPVLGLSIGELLARLKRGPPIVRTVAELRSRSRQARRDGKRIGLVPTMGALHAGHRSLARAASRECSFNIVTIFVNPTQFGPNEDYARYPRTMDQDLALLADSAVDLVFGPDRTEMYQAGHSTYVEVQGPASRWEGAARAGHFQGVATIVLKLFHAAEPDVAFFGQKDYQQCAVVRRMVADLDLPIEIRVCPTMRDSDGLALSSRNVYLSTDERRRALSLSQSLKRAAELFRQGNRDAAQIVAAMTQILKDAPVEIDYVAIVDPETLEPVAEVQVGSVALVAARVGTTRLIDNQIFE